MSFFTVEASGQGGGDETAPKVGAGGTVRHMTAAETTHRSAAKEGAALDIDPQVLVKAIEAHTQWKTKLRQCMSDHSKCSDPATVEKDNLCGLGQWIYGDGRKLANEPQFEQLRVDHATFHKCAAKVIREIQANRLGDAERLMANEYTDIAQKVIGGLTKMKARCR
jgi:hypothetical protein